MLYGFCRDEMAQAWAYATGQSEASSVQSMEKLGSPCFTLDISNFCKWVAGVSGSQWPQESGGDGKRIIFLVDEVGQFIGNNTQMMLKLQTITENLGTACGGTGMGYRLPHKRISMPSWRSQREKRAGFLKNPGTFSYPDLPLLIQYQRSHPKASARKNRSG